MDEKGGKSILLFCSVLFCLFCGPWINSVQPASAVFPQCHSVLVCASLVVLLLVLLLCV
jgi:hypothetical protein